MWCGTWMVSQYDKQLAVGKYMVNGPNMTGGQERNSKQIET